MAGSFISFTDGVGAAQLDNGMTGISGAVGSRFRNWVSMPQPIGPAKASLGTGQRVMFRFRTDYKASFELENIPNANVIILDRLIEFLLNGGIVSVTTGDSLGSVYATCCLAEGTTPQKKMDNSQDITWTLSLVLVNVAGSPVAMTCVYTS